jgi:hypothetical protein
MDQQERELQQQLNESRERLAAEQAEREAAMNMCAIVRVRRGCDSRMCACFNV